MVNKRISPQRHRGHREKISRKKAQKAQNKNAEKNVTQRRKGAKVQTETNREWIRLRNAYGATGYELTRMKPT